MPTSRTLFRELSQRPDAARTLALLKELAARPLEAGELVSFHEQCLFYKAYPRSEALYDFCARELKDFVKRTDRLEEEDLEALDQTGIAGTRIFYPYDLESVSWLTRRLKGRIEVDWDEYAERDDDPLSELLPMFAVKAEEDALDDEAMTAREFIDSAKSEGQTALGWLLERFETAFESDVRSHLYGRMQLPLVMKLDPRGPSRTVLDDGRPDRIFIWNPEESRVKFDLISEIKRPIVIPLPVDPKRGRGLLDLAVGTLLPRLRELYPLTHANPAEVYDLPLERGIRLVIWFMKPEFRLPLEAGWGLLLLKNGVPIGYGAGGMLADRSEIAINIFDTFRGGEAAWLYAQYARVFNAFCSAPWLVTRRYQIGYENEEGITSGAYWFWDKLGFRSTDPVIRKLADQERRMIAKQKGYRTPRRVLKQLCQSDIVLSLAGEPAEQYDEFPLAQAGLAASRVVAGRFVGDRGGLEGKVLQILKEKFNFSPDGLSPAEKSSVAQIGIFLLAIPEQQWGGLDRAAFLEMARQKGSVREADYARAFRKNRRFFEALAAIK